MHRIFPVMVILLIFTVLESCSKRNVPSRSEPTIELRDNTSVDMPAAPITKKSDSAVAVKPAIRKTAPVSTPKVIVVNDKFAKKSVDGRHYYDLQGHRYWRSNKDGKYYLYNKSMQNDAAFKKPL